MPLPQQDNLFHRLNVGNFACGFKAVAFYINGIYEIITCEPQSAQDEESNQRRTWFEICGPQPVSTFPINHFVELLAACRPSTDELVVPNYVL